MRRAILSFLLFAMPAAMFADTVIMKDGTRYTGTFVRGTSRMITITDDSGSRRNLDLTNVQQISFGNGYSDNSGAYSNNSGRYTYQNSTSTGDVSYVVGRLQDDIRSALNNGNMNNSDRETLQRASDRLRVASENYNSGNRVDMQEVRSALADVRYVMENSRMSTSDRQRLSDDLQQMNQLRVSNGNWSNETGTRSRRRDDDDR